SGNGVVIRVGETRVVSGAGPHLHRGSLIDGVRTRARGRADGSVTLAGRQRRATGGAEIDAPENLIEQTQSVAGRFRNFRTGADSVERVQESVIKEVVRVEVHRSVEFLGNRAHVTYISGQVPVDAAGNRERHVLDVGARIVRVERGEAGGAGTCC